MCGIAGILDDTTKRPPQSDELTAMQQIMRHRGPDGDGQWISPEGNVGLAHLRLAIIDLSAKAAQPMTDGQDKVWITFNGEIYNHATLRKQLEEAGRHFTTDHSDTEVLVHGYLEWGIDGLLQRLEGMYSFAIWDCEYKKLVNLMRTNICNYASVAFTIIKPIGSFIVSLPMWTYTHSMFYLTNYTFFN